MWDPKVLRLECYNIYVLLIFIIYILKLYCIVYFVVWDPNVLRMQCYNIYYLHITIVLYNLFYNVGSKFIENVML